MKSTLLFALAGLFLVSSSPAQELEKKPDDPYFENFRPKQAPRASRLWLKQGDRLAICGDSITEQRMYSRIMETYLTVCVPQLDVTVRQYGWGGEVAPGFLARMTNDCLRFKPTIATTCYGMNDHGYRAYEPAIGDRYRKYQTAIVDAFKAAGTRVVLGSPGCVSHKAEALNLNLCELRNIDIGIAEEKEVGFADVFWPMLTAERVAHQRYATNYWIGGKDGVHPDWAGHLVMAYAFLKGLGLDGDIGTFTINLDRNTAQASAGHEVVSEKAGEFAIKSLRYPFCAAGDVTKDSTIRSGMTLVPFNAGLNRLTLVAKNGKASRYKVTWGADSKTYSADQLAQGINLAEDFATNPFSAAFARVDSAVTAKQEYETRQVKTMFHGPEAKFEMEALADLTERVRAPLAASVRKAFVPVTHTIIIAAE